MKLPVEQMSFYDLWKLDCQIRSEILHRYWWVILLMLLILLIIYTYPYIREKYVK